VSQLRAAFISLLRPSLGDKFKRDPVILTQIFHGWFHCFSSCWHCTLQQAMIVSYQIPSNTWYTFISHFALHNCSFSVKAFKSTTNQIIFCTRLLSFSYIGSYCCDHNNKDKEWEVYIEMRFIYIHTNIYTPLIIQ